PDHLLHVEGIRRPPRGRVPRARQADRRPLRRVAPSERPQPGTLSGSAETLPSPAGDPSRPTADPLRIRRDPFRIGGNPLRIGGNPPVTGRRPFEGRPETLPGPTG